MEKKLKSETITVKPPTWDEVVQIVLNTTPSAENWRKSLEQLGRIGTAVQTAHSEGYTHLNLETFKGENIERAIH